MHDTNAIWNSLAETGKAHCKLNDSLWEQLLKEAQEEGVRIREKLLADCETWAIYLRRASS